MTESVALVTGASSGIGAAFARELARRGFSLVLVARRLDRLERLKNELTGTPVDSLAADLASDEGVALVSRRLGLGGISLLVNNAGTGFRGRFAEQSVDGISSLIRLNLEAPVRLTRSALPPMLSSRKGSIINVISMSAFQPVPYLNVYAATKAGLLSFTEALAAEVEGTGIRVQALCPGNIPTEFQETAGTKGSRFDRTPSMSADTVARYALDALERNAAALQIPGGMDRVSVFAQRFLPRSVARGVAGRLMKPE